jgi:glycosyltransferase involved in cell wall biosynthesis
VNRVLCCHPSAELYGSDRVFLESVAALAERGPVVVVTVPAPGPLTERAGELGARVICRPAPVLRKAALRPRGLLALLAETVRAVPGMLALLRSVRPDVVYVSTVTVPLWPVLARLTGARVVVHVHEAEDGVPRLVRAALAAPLLAAHRVLVNSDATGRSVRAALPRLAGRIRLLRNGIAGPPERLPRPGPGPVIRVVLVGRLSPRKGTDVAVEALALLGPGFTLDLYGSVFPGYEWFETRLRARIAELGLTDSVRWHGFQADVWPAYAAADVAVVPSRQEPFGNTAVEARLAGVPVVVTDVQGLPETVAGGRAGFVVPPEDPHALAEAIRAAAGSPAPPVPEEEFSPQHYRKLLLELLSTTD